MNLIEKMNKRADAGFGVKKIIILILILAVIVLALIFMWKFDLITKLKDLFPDFNNTLVDTADGKMNIEDVQAKQAGISNGEKSLICTGTRPYKSVFLIFDTTWMNIEDLFEFRFNENLNSVQIYFKINGKYSPDEWLIHPDLFEMFKKNEKIDEKEAQQVVYLMKAKTKENFAERLESISKESSWVIYFNENDKKESMTKEEILKGLDNTKEKEFLEKNKEEFKKTFPECF